MIYREFKPSKYLAPYVECYWIALSDKPPFRERESLIPDGTIELMFNFGDDYSHVSRGEERIIKGSHVIGIRKKSQQICQRVKQNFFSIRFKLGGIFPFIKIPVNEFANDFFELDQLFASDYKELEERLFESPSPVDRIAIAENFLLRKLYGRELGDYHFVSHCSKLLEADSHFRVKDLSLHLNTNYKTLERKFKKVIGLTPSELLKVKRFNRAVLSIYSFKYRSLTDIAYQCGYYDQSHFIREFKHLTTFTPRDFLKEQFTIVQVIQPALAERLSNSYNF